MTERDKIIEAINSVQAYGIMINAFGEDLPVTNEMLADALVAAGIGDISKWQLMSKVLHNQIIENSREEKHRAEVAERQAIFLSKMLADKTRKDYPWQAWFDAAQKQAKKELSEEKNND